MKIDIEISQADLRKLVAEHLRQSLGDMQIDEAHVIIEVKSKQNYRAEWEPADFRAKYVASL